MVTHRETAVCHGLSSFLSLWHVRALYFLDSTDSNDLTVGGHAGVKLYCRYVCQHTTRRILACPTACTP